MTYHSYGHDRRRRHGEPVFGVIVAVWLASLLFTVSVGGFVLYLAWKLVTHITG